MKLDHFEARSHALEQFGRPAFECTAWTAWRPSRNDCGIELILRPDGLFCFGINGNRGFAFRADYSKLTAANLRSIAWSTGFSWTVADELASKFGCVVDPTREA
jgi:hypothetical protein